MHRLTRPENRGIMVKTDLETGIEEEGEEEALKGAKMRGDLQEGELTKVKMVLLKKTFLKKVRKRNKILELKERKQKVWK